MTAERTMEDIARSLRTIAEVAAHPLMAVGPAPKVEPACIACKHSRLLGARSGSEVLICRRRPPVTAPGDGTAWWPYVSPVDACGEFDLRPRDQMADREYFEGALSR